MLALVACHHRAFIDNVFRGELVYCLPSLSNRLHTLPLFPFLFFELFHSLVFCLCSLSFYHPFSPIPSLARRNVSHCYDVCTSMECELPLVEKEMALPPALPSISHGMRRSESTLKYSCHEFFQFSISFLFEHVVKVLKFALNAFNRKHRQ